jgi:hypothetical protein
VLGGLIGKLVARRENRGYLLHAVGEAKIALA